MTAKAQAVKVIEKLPDNSTLPDIIRALTIFHMIEESLADIAAGRTFTQAEVAKEAETWFKPNRRRGCQHHNRKLSR